MRSTVVVFAVAGLMSSASPPAEACSPPVCFGGAFLPGDQGHVPANAPGLLWRAMFDYDAPPDPAKVVLTSAADPATPIAFTARPLADHEFLLTPDAPLAPGSYVITDRTVCGDAATKGPSVLFSVTPAAAMPTSLGALVAMPASRQQLDLMSRSGACSSPAMVVGAAVELVPSSAAQPWLDLLQFQTLVDGGFWQYQTGLDFSLPPGQSPLGRARDRVYQVCSSSDPTVSGLAAGKHVVKMTAQLPGITQGVVSDPIDVTLQCDPGSGDPGTGDPGGEPRTGGGCSAGGGTGSGLGLALLALAAPLRRRPRGRRGP